MKTRLILLTFLVGMRWTLFADPSGVRELPTAGISSAQTYLTRIVIDPGATPPSSLVIEEVIPVGWQIVAATWNGQSFPPDSVVDNRWKWLFGYSRPVAAGTLVYETRPVAVEEKAYPVTGYLKFGDTGVRVITGGGSVAALDTDSDGLPDDWELRYFQHPTGANADSDPDQDGASTRAEYVARTHPLDSGSRLALTFCGVEAGRWVIRWKGGAGSRVELLYRATLDPAAILQRVVIKDHPDESEQEWSLPVASVPSGFFQLRTQR